MNRLPALSLLGAACVAGLLGFAQGRAQDAAPPPADPAAHAEAEAPAATKLPLLDLRRIRPLQGDPAAGKAKSELCSACHGEQGIAIVPIFPNLAGQRAEYLYWQLLEYKRGNLPQSTMTPIIDTLDDADMRDLSMYYASLPHNPPLPADRPVDESAEPPDPALLARGRALYMDGEPARGVPACQGCHGADALGFPDALKPNRNGHTPYAVFPILRGQQRDYLQIRLAQYQNGDISDSSSDLVMNEVGHRLDADGIAAIASYLSQLNQ